MTVIANAGLADWGALVLGSDIDDAIIDTCKTWSNTYFDQMRIERNLSFSPAPPRTYANTFMGQEFFDHQLPAIIITTAQLNATKGGPNLDYQGTWQMRVATVIRAKNPPATRKLSALYEGTVRRMLTQKAAADETNPINDLHYDGFGYEEVPDATGQGRYALAAISRFQVFTDRVVQPFGGPDVPDAESYLDYPPVTEIDIDVLGETLVINS